MALFLRLKKLIYFTDLECNFLSHPSPLSHASGQINSKTATVLKMNMLVGGTKELPKNSQVFCSEVS